MSFAWNVGGDFNAIGQANAGDLPERRVGLLRRHDLHLQTDAAFLRTAGHGRMPRLAVLLHASFLHELIDRRHSKLRPFRFAKYERDTIFAAELVVKSR